MSKRAPKHKPRWHQTKFGLLLNGYYFKATKSQATWWVKLDHCTASSENGQLKSPWTYEDTVWVDISTNLERSRFLGTGHA